MSMTKLIVKFVTECGLRIFVREVSSAGKGGEDGEEEGEKGKESRQPNIDQGGIFYEHSFVYGLCWRVPSHVIPRLDLYLACPCASWNRNP